MLKFYYAPWSRASGVRWLLEELGVDYEGIHIDIRAVGGVPESYRKIHPNKKVPAIEHDGIVITERSAITIYLADAFPESKLAPAIGSVERGPYLTTTIYVDSVMDPCIKGRMNGLSYKSNEYSFGLFEDMVLHLERQLTAQPYAVGPSFTAADTQLASAISFTMDNLKALPAKQVFKDYLARIAERPAYKRARMMDYQDAQAIPALISVG